MTVDPLKSTCTQSPNEPKCINITIIIIIITVKLSTITLHHAILSSSTGATEDPESDPAASRERTHDRGRSHDRKHHSSADKQRYYSCDRYCSREHCHTKSATTSCVASPSEGQETSTKQVGGQQRVE